MTWIYLQYSESPAWRMLVKMLVHNESLGIFHPSRIETARRKDGSLAKTFQWIQKVVNNKINNKQTTSHICRCNLPDKIYCTIIKSYIWKYIVSLSDDTKPFDLSCKCSLHAQAVFHSTRRVYIVSSASSVSSVIMFDTHKAQCCFNKHVDWFRAAVANQTAVYFGISV